MEDEDDDFDDAVKELRTHMTRVAEMMEKFREAPSSATSKELADQAQSLFDETMDFRNCFLELAYDPEAPDSDDPEASREFQAVLDESFALCDGAEELAASIPGSRAAEDRYETAQMVITLMTQVQAKQGRLTDDEKESEEKATKSIIAHWRNQGLSEEAAYSAAALEITELRSRAASR